MWTTEGSFCVRKHELPPPISQESNNKNTASDGLDGAR